MDDADGILEWNRPFFFPRTKEHFVRNRVSSENRACPSKMVVGKGQFLSKLQAIKPAQAPKYVGLRGRKGRAYANRRCTCSDSRMSTVCLSYNLGNGGYTKTKKQSYE